MTEPNEIVPLPPKMPAMTDGQRTKEGVTTTTEGVATMATAIEGSDHVSAKTRPSKVQVVALVTCVAKGPQEGAILKTKAELEAIDSRMSSVAIGQLVESTIDNDLLMTEKFEPMEMDPELLIQELLAIFLIIVGLVGEGVHLTTMRTRTLEVVADLEAINARLDQRTIVERTTENDADLLPLLRPAVTVKAAAMTVDEIHRNAVGPILRILDS